jgi:putative transposase
MGMLKGKIAIKIFKSFPLLKKKPYWGNPFWSRCYCVSTIGLDETKIRKYVKYQEDREKQEEEEQKEFVLFKSPLKSTRYTGGGLLIQETKIPAYIICYIV